MKASKKNQKNYNSGVLEITITPENKVSNSRFYRFKKWLGELRINTNLNTDDVSDFIESSIDAELQKKKKHKLENEQLISEIKLRLLQSKLNEQEIDKNSLFAEYELELLKAQKEKTLAEAEAIRTDSRIKALKLLNEIGVDASPLIQNGEIKGLYITKDNKST